MPRLLLWPPGTSRIPFPLNVPYFTSFPNRSAPPSRSWKADGGKPMCLTFSSQPSLWKRRLCKKRQCSRAEASPPILPSGCEEFRRQRLVDLVDGADELSRALQKIWMRIGLGRFKPQSSLILPLRSVNSRTSSRDTLLAVTHAMAVSAMFRRPWRFISFASIGNFSGPPCRI
jgi:hypothetical protein